MDPDIDTKVIGPMLTEKRKPGYLRKPEYSHLKELSTSIYLSSAWQKTHWSYEKFTAEMEKMAKIDISPDADNTVRENRSYIVGLPWDVSLYEGLLDIEKALEEVGKESMSRAGFMMEFLAMFYGQAENAFFTLDDITRNRILMKAFVPKTNIQRMLEAARPSNEKKSSYFTFEKKKPQELRVICADVARAPGKGNDVSVFSCGRLIETNNGYDVHIVHMESHEGVSFQRQSIRLKQLYEDFEADYVGVDILGAGAG